MEKQLLISSSILSADMTRLGEQIREVQEAGVDWIHVDVIDGHFAPNITMGPFIVGACRRATDMPLDVHLMIEKPEQYLKSFVEAGASILTVHVEACPHIYRTLEEIRNLGCKVGISLNPGTPADVLVEVLHLVDMVLVMTVTPGFSGQTYNHYMEKKVIQIRRMLDDINPQAVIEVDGGITPDTLPGIMNAGAEVFVAATAIFKYPAGIKAGVNALRASMQTGKEINR